MWQNLWSHAPRERVSWNAKTCKIISTGVVTLHVSVWVEIQSRQQKRQSGTVTLHVSVWVEMQIFSPTAWMTASRSTWACELKFTNKSTTENIASHAPRERVSWNPTIRQNIRSCWVTLHVSVWVEILIQFLLYSFIQCHAPRERVSWNSTSAEIMW